MSSLMARKCFFSEFFGANFFFILPAILAGMQFVPALQGRSKLRCENRLTPPLLPGSALRQAQGPHSTATRSAPFQSGLGFISSTPPVLISVVGKYRFSIIVIQKNVKKALEWRRETWQKSICAERTRQRSFKPRSESDTLYPRSAFLTRFLPGMEVLSC